MSAELGSSGSEMLGTKTGASAPSPANEMSPAQRTRPLLRRGWPRGLAALAGAIQLGLQLAIGIPVAWNNGETKRDVHQLYTHATMVRNGERLYSPWPTYGPDVMTLTGRGYTQRRQPYPPFLTPALSTIAGLPYIQFERIWTLVLFAAFWVYAACLAKIATGRLDPAWVLGAGGILAITPGAYYALGLGNVDPLLWAATGIALAFPPLRGAGFAFTALVKLYGAWPLLFAWRREGRRVFSGGAAAVAAATLVSVAVMGLTRFTTSFVDWFRYMLPVVGQGTFNGINFSLPVGALRGLRLLGWTYTNGPLPGWAKLWLVGAGLVGPLATGFLLRRRSPAFQASLVVCAATAFGPVLWPTYLPLFLAPLAVLVGEQVTAGPALPLEGRT